MFLDPTRRHFLIASGASLAALPMAQGLAANDKLNLGLIGSGGRGRTLLRECVKLGHNAVALCDIAPFRLESVLAMVAKEGSQAEPPVCYRDYRKLLDHAKLDAVIVATPDHHHREHLLAVMEADKDCYIEKPLTKSLEEGKEMIEAVRKARRVVQVGNQRHSGVSWKRCREVIESSDFGDLVWAKVWDCRNWTKKDPFAPPDWFTKEVAREIDWDQFLGKAPKRAFDAKRYWSWRWYWDYAGGLMTDIGAHQLDIVQWLGGVEAPKSVVANGGVYRFKHWETPDVIHGVWDYGKFAATFAVEFVNGADGVGMGFYGTKMTILADADKEVKIYDTIDKITPDTKPVDHWPAANETAQHVKNWLDCVQSRREPNSPIELGHRVITAAHLANLSYRTGKKIYWDADRQEVIGG